MKEELRNEIAADSEYYIRTANSIIIKILRKRPGIITGEDIFQETFLRLDSGSRTWVQGSNSVRTTFNINMKSVINNEFRNLMRLEKLFSRFSYKEPPVKDPTEEILNSMIAANVMKELFRWASEHRNENMHPVLLLKLEGFTAKEISEKTGISIDTVNNMLKEIRKKAAGLLAL